MSSEPALWRLAIGQPFSPERMKWDDGRFEYRFFKGNHLLQVCLSSPKQSEIDAFRSGKMNIGLYVERNVIFFLFRIEGCMDWSDQALSIQLVPSTDRELPPLKPGMRTLLSMVLVDADTGLVAALRAVTFSPQFTRLMNQAQSRQLDLPFDADEHQAVIADVYRRFPNSKELAKAAMVIEKAGAKTP
ncbi:MAG: hypothetical protein KJZ90_00010 [Rhodocyclaceae bacterium]|nr:hypothetical protein [Rhodocyclaceae bacterium]